MIHPDNVAHIGFVSTPGDHAQAQLIYDADREFSLQAIGKHVAHHCWLSKRTESEAWVRMAVTPGWISHKWYKYDPQVSEGTMSDRFLHPGETYWCVNLLAPDYLHEGIWEDTQQQREWLRKELIFKSKDRALNSAETLANYIKSCKK